MGLSVDPELSAGRHISLKQEAKRDCLVNFLNENAI